MMNFLFLVFFWQKRVVDCFRFRNIIKEAAIVLVDLKTQA